MLPQADVPACLVPGLQKSVLRKSRRWTENTERQKVLSQNLPFEMALQNLPFEMALRVTPPRARVPRVGLM